MSSSQIVFLTVSALALTIVGILAARAINARAERELAAARAAEAQAVTDQRQHQLALVGNGARVEEIVMSGDYFHATMAVGVPQNAELPQALRQQGAGGGEGDPVAFRHTRPGGVTEWMTGAPRPDAPQPPAGEGGVRVEVNPTFNVGNTPIPVPTPTNAAATVTAAETERAGPNGGPNQPS